MSDGNDGTLGQVKKQGQSHHLDALGLALDHPDDANDAADSGTEDRANNFPDTKVGVGIGRALFLFALERFIKNLAAKAALGGIDLDQLPAHGARVPVPALPFFRRFGRLLNGVALLGGSSRLHDLVPRFWFVDRLRLIDRFRFQGAAGNLQGGLAVGTNGSFAGRVIRRLESFVT